MTKSLLFLCSILFLIGSANAQVVPNGNFEGPPFDWAGSGTGGILTIGGQKSFKLLEDKDTTILSAEGRSSAFMKNDDKVAGLTTRTKFPIDVRPMYFGFLHNYFPHASGEKGHGRLMLTKLNSSTQEIDTILNAIIVLDNVVLDWSRISMDLTDEYLSTETPDSAYLEFMVSSDTISSPESFLTVDDILLIAPTIDVENPILDEELTIFPNPSTGGNIQFEMNSAYVGQVDLTITDINGRVVRIAQFDKNTVGKHSERLDLSTLASGSYTATFDTRNGQVSKMLIVE